jgi:asparagine synthase (glutamine-hydrolysing)
MCGIGALLDPGGNAPADAPRRMIEELRHRGPDGDAVRRAGAATLCHTRLAIIDVAGGDQPLDSEDGRVSAIVNGEIYNHRELRSQLEQRGHTFATHSDSEVVVHAYEEDGTGCVERLNGIFAFALWDERARRLVAARDPFGVKPLYWWSDGRRVALASEIGAILATGLVRPEVDPLGLDHYLACRFVPAPRTLFAGIHKLPPASVLVCDEGGAPRLESYRTPPGRPLDDTSEPELAGELAERFTDAVERQMMSDVPYGAFLSGGVDSAAVVAAMAGRSADPPTTFTIGFPGHGDVLDERQYAAESARVIGTDHRDTAMAQTDFLAELARCMPRLEEPCGIPSAPALMQLSRFTGESVKVVLAGQGADEPHGGYGRHQAAAVLRHLARLPGFAAGPVAAAARALPRLPRARRVAHLLGNMPDSERLLRLVEITDRRQREALSGRGGDDAVAERRALADDVLSDVPDRDLLERALYLDTRLFLPSGILICNDKMSMAASLELRVPFLDVELMRFVERIPGRLRVRPRQGKRLHRAAMGRLLPDEITSRPRHGFASPYDDWLRGSLGEEVDRRYAPGSALSELIDPATASRLVSDHRSGRANHKDLLYCLLELSEWHRVFIERAGEREPAAVARSG